MHNLTVLTAPQYLLDVAKEEFLPGGTWFPLALHVIEDKDFLAAPGSSGGHQAFPGGLALHTAEVLHHCLTMDGRGVDTDVLVMAAIWHDFHKKYEYSIDHQGSGGAERIVKLSYRKLIGHVVGSAIEFSAEANKVGMDPKYRDEILHCMLAHHGRLEWRSPVEPQTREAFILHAADMLSARIEGGAI